jgi:hypothetical protein
VLILSEFTLLSGFAAVTLSGIGSVHGAMPGGHVIGVACEGVSLLLTLQRRALAGLRRGRVPTGSEYTLALLSRYGNRMPVLACVSSTEVRPLNSDSLRWRCE